MPTTLHSLALLLAAGARMTNAVPIPVVSNVSMTMEGQQAMQPHQVNMDTAPAPIQKLASVMAASSVSPKKRCAEGKHAGMGMTKSDCQARCRTTSGCTHAVHFADNGCQISTNGCTLVSHSYPTVTDEIFKPDKPLGEHKKLKIYSVLDDSNKGAFAASNFRNGCGLEFDNNWIGNTERKAKWDCPPTGLVGGTTRRKIEAMNQFSSKIADPIWFEPAPKWPMVRVYVRDYQGRKCGLEWDGQWDLGYGKRSAKFDCKGNADPIEMIKETRKSEIDQLSSYVGEVAYASNIRRHSWGFFHMKAIDGSGNSCYLKVTGDFFRQRRYTGGSKKGQYYSYDTGGGDRSAYWTCGWEKHKVHGDTVMVVPANMARSWEEDTNYIHDEEE